MTPREQVEDLYLKYPQPRTFAEDRALYEACGVVMDEPEIFMMAKAVCKSAPEAAIRCPWVYFDRWTQNAWFIFALAGDIRGMLRAAPYHLPSVGWSRRMAPIRWHSARRVCECVEGFNFKNKYICQTQK